MGATVLLCIMYDTLVFSIILYSAALGGCGDSNYFCQGWRSRQEEVCVQGREREGGVCGSVYNTYVQYQKRVRTYDRI